MRLEEWSIASPSAQLLLVALLVGAAEAPAEAFAVSRAHRAARARLIGRLKRLSLVELERAAVTGSLQHSGAGGALCSWDCDSLDGRLGCTNEQCNQQQLGIPRRNWPLFEAHRPSSPA